MTIATEIISKLETTPSFRERRFRDSYLLEMVLAKNGIDSTSIPAEKLGDVVKDYMSYERIWRDVLEDDKRPDLRGEDWSDGKILDQQYQLRVLDREVGYKEMTENEKYELFG